MKKHLKIILVLTCLIVLLSLLVIVYFKKVEKTNNNSTNNTINNNDIKTTDENKLGDFKIDELKLSSNEETKKIDDKLEIKFVSTNNSTNYSATILFNGNKSDISFFNGDNIWPYALTGTFTIYSSSNYYILESFIVSQCDGRYVLILDNSGKVLKTYNDVYFSFDGEIITVTDTDICGVDSTPSSSEEYNINDLK